MFAEPVPAAIGAGQDHDAEQHERAGRHATLRHRHRKTQILPRLDPRLGPEASGHLLRRQAERGRVGAEESERVGGAGQILDAAALDRLEIGLPDAQALREFRQRPAEPLARGAQFRAEPGGRRKLLDLLHSSLACRRTTRQLIQGAIWRAKRPRSAAWGETRRAAPDKKGGMKRLLIALLLLAPAARATDFGAFLAGQFAASQGDFGAAATDMMDALDADPGSAALRRDAFTLSLLAGRPEAASLAADLPDDPAAQLVLANAKARAGDWQGAELIYAELPHQGALDTLRPMLVAWAQQAQGRTDRALQTLQAAMAGDHLTVFYLLHAALIADVDHRDGLAARLYGELQHAAAGLNLRLAQILASWQARSGHPDQARATIDAAVRGLPDLRIVKQGLLASMDQVQVGDAKQGIAEAYASVAGVLHGQEDGALPALLLRLALAMNPDLGEARLIAAELAANDHQDKLAAADLAAFPASDPLAPLAQLRLAGIEARLGQTQKAQSMLETLAREHPDSPDPLSALGNLYSDEHRYKDAIAAYSDAIARVPHPGKNEWALFYLRGTAEERAHDAHAAESDMQTALKLAPDQPFALNFLGFSWTEENRNLKQARDMIERALQQRPDDGAIVDSLGWVMLRQGDVAGAVRTLERAAELEPNDPTITGHLGDAYWAAGRHVEAEDQWRRALVLNPEPDDAARIETRLKRATASAK